MNSVTIINAIKGCLGTSVFVLIPIACIVLAIAGVAIVKSIKTEKEV